jgi:hypothetical protein
VSRSKDSAWGALAVTPDDDDAWTPATAPSYLWVGTGGALAIVDHFENTVIFGAVPNGSLLKVSPLQVLANGTDASDIVALFVETEPAAPE